MTPRASIWPATTVGKQEASHRIAVDRTVGGKHFDPENRSDVNDVTALLLLHVRQGRGFLIDHVDHHGDIRPNEFRQGRAKRHPGGGRHSTQPRRPGSLYAFPAIYVLPNRGLTAKTVRHRAFLPQD
jgi:hypothetical protein